MVLITKKMVEELRGGGDSQVSLNWKVDKKPLLVLFSKPLFGAVVPSLYTKVRKPLSACRAVMGGGGDVTSRFVLLSTK